MYVRAAVVQNGRQFQADYLHLLAKTTLNNFHKNHSDCIFSISVRNNNNNSSNNNVVIKSEFNINHRFHLCFKQISIERNICLYKRNVYNIHILNTKDNLHPRAEYIISAYCL